MSAFAKTVKRYKQLLQQHIINQMTERHGHLIAIYQEESLFPSNFTSNFPQKCTHLYKL